MHENSSDCRGGRNKGEEGGPYIDSEEGRLDYVFVGLAV